MLGHSGSDDKHYNGMNWRGKIGWFYFYYTSLYHNAIWRRIAESRHFWSMFNEVKLLFRIEQKRNSITRHHHRIPNCFTVYDSGNVATSSIRYPSSNSTWLLCFFFLNHLTAETTRAKSVDARRMLVRLSPLRHIKRTTYFIIIYCSLMQVSYDRFFFFCSLFSYVYYLASWQSWHSHSYGRPQSHCSALHVQCSCQFNFCANLAAGVMFTVSRWWYIVEKWCVCGALYSWDLQSNAWIFATPQTTLLHDNRRRMNAGPHIIIHYFCSCTLWQAKKVHQSSTKHFSGKAIGSFYFSSHSLS